MDAAQGTVNVLDWLDQVRTLLKGNYPELLEEEFERVKSHIVGLANESRAAVQFASTQNLFEEIGGRHDCSLLVTSKQKKRGSQPDVSRMYLGPLPAVIGLSVLATQDLVRRTDA